MAPTVTRNKSIDDLYNQYETANNNINKRFDALEAKFVKVLEENELLKATNTKLEKEMLGMRNHLNNLEQYQRNYSVRINNLQLPEEIIEDPYKVRDHVYSKVMLPILRGAVEEGHLAGVPNAHQLLEVAHVLPGADGKPKPIIARFLNRNDRSVVLKCKKKFATRAPSNNRKSAYPIYEDLTRDTFSLYKRIMADERSVSVWSIRGQIRYKLSDSDTVKKVDNVYLPFESYFT